MTHPKPELRNPKAEMLARYRAERAKTRRLLRWLDRRIATLAKAALLLALVSASAVAAPVTDYLLDAVRFVESSDGRRLVGDDGRSLGPYQLTAGAVRDCGLRSAECGVYRLSESSRAAARAYLVKLNGQLTRAIGREPTEAGLYCAYNLGFAKFRALGFRLDRCNAAGRRAAVTVELRARDAEFAALVARGRQLAASRPGGER